MVHLLSEKAVVILDLCEIGVWTPPLFALSTCRLRDKIYNSNSSNAKCRIEYLSDGLAVSV